jgi:hypothetical protein
MPAKGPLHLRFAMLCGIGALTIFATHGQFLEPPDTNLFGSEFVKTFDMRGGRMVRANDRTSKKNSQLEGYEHLLLFRDGRQLRGRILSAGKDEILWKRPDFSEPLHLPRTGVHRVYLTPDAPNGMASFAPNTVRFMPGASRAGRRNTRSGIVPATIKLGGNDWLRGAVTSPDGQSLTLLLDGKGPSMTMPRSQIEWLFFDWNLTRGGGFDGSIPSAEDWLASAPSASLADDGTLMIAGQNEWFGRLLPQPPLFEISMEITADSEQGTHLWLQPSGPMPNAFSTGAVDVGFDPKQLSLQRFTNVMENKTFPISESGAWNAKGIVRYRIFYDSDKHRLVVFRNGRLVTDWKPDEPKPGDANGNSIRPEILTYLVRMSFPNIIRSASLGAAVDALLPPVDGLCLEGVPELMAAASYSNFAAQLLISELRARFPRINGISLCGEPAKNGDQSKTPLKLRRFQVSPWDGTLPQEGEAAATEDRLSSAASGSIAGKLDSITETDVIFSQQNNSKLPGMFIRLPRVSDAPFDSVARVGMGASGELSVASLEIREGRAHLHTAFADDLELPAPAVNAISFPSLNPHSPMKGDSLVFKNGDELPGSLISAANDAPLRWKMPGGQEVAIEFKNAAGIRFANPAPSNTAAESARVELRNGDRLRGEVVSFDENRLSFKEPSLGPLSVDRSRIGKLFPQAGAKIRDGADNPAGWESAELNVGPFLNRRPRQSQLALKPAWLYFDGCYIPRQTSRQNGQMETMFLSAPVPDQRDGLFEIRADLTVTGDNFPNAMISIAGKPNENGVTPAVSINFSGMELYVNVMNSTRGQRFHQVALGGKMGKLSTRLSFRVFINSVLGTVDIMMDGTLIARIGQQGDERAPGIGQAVQIGGLAYDGKPLIYSNLWIGPWDGELPREETTGHTSTALANGDVTPGVPSALKDGQYLLQTEVGPLQLPAAAISAIAFGGESAQTRSAARLRLVDGSIVHVSSFECMDRSLASHSELFGDLHLPMESIDEIVFAPEPLRIPLEPAPKKPAQAAEAGGAATPARPFEAQ